MKVAVWSGLNQGCCTQFVNEECLGLLGLWPLVHQGNTHVHACCFLERERECGWRGVVERLASRKGMGGGGGGLQELVARFGPDKEVRYASRVTPRMPCGLVHLLRSLEGRRVWLR